MTYKTKSLVYFFSFVIAATAYHILDQYQDFKEQMSSREVVETTFDQDAGIEENPQEELAQLQE